MRCLLLYPSGPNGGTKRITQSVVLDPSKITAVSIWVLWKQSNANCFGQILLKTANTEVPLESFEDFSGIGAPANTWKKYELVFVPPTAALNLIIEIGCGYPGGFELLIDDIAATTLN